MLASGFYTSPPPGGNEDRKPPSPNKTPFTKLIIRWDLLISFIIGLLILLGIILGAGCLIESRNNHMALAPNETTLATIPQYNACEAAADYGIAMGPVLMVMGASQLISMLVRGFFGIRRSRRLTILATDRFNFVQRTRRACLRTRRMAQSLLPNLAAVTIIMYGSALIYTGIDCRSGISLIRLVIPSLFRPSTTPSPPTTPFLTHPPGVALGLHNPCRFFSNASPFYQEDTSNTDGIFTNTSSSITNEGISYPNGSIIFPNGTEVCSDGTIRTPNGIIFTNGYQIGSNTLAFPSINRTFIFLNHCNATGFSTMHAPSTPHNPSGLSYVDPTPWLNMLSQFCQGANLTNATSSTPTTSFNTTTTSLTPLSTTFINSTTLMNTSATEIFNNLTTPTNSSNSTFTSALSTQPTIPISSTTNALINLTTLMNTSATEISNHLTTPTNSSNSTFTSALSTEPTSSTTNPLTNLTSFITITDLTNLTNSTNFITDSANFTDPVNSIADTSVPPSCTWVAGLDMLAGVALLTGAFLVSNLITRLIRRFSGPTQRYIELQELNNSNEENDNNNEEDDAV